MRRSKVTSTNSFKTLGHPPLPLWRAIIAVPMLSLKEGRRDKPPKLWQVQPTLPNHPNLLLPSEIRLHLYQIYELRTVNCKNLEPVLWIINLYHPRYPGNFTPIFFAATLGPPHEPRSSVSVRDAPGHQAKKVPGPRLPSKNAPGTEEPQFEHTVDGSEIRLSSWYSKYPIIYRVLAPSQVVVGDFFHQQ